MADTGLHLLAWEEAVVSFFERNCCAYWFISMMMSCNKSSSNQELFNVLVLGVFRWDGWSRGSFKVGDFRSKRWRSPIHPFRCWLIGQWVGSLLEFGLLLVLLLIHVLLSSHLYLSLMTMMLLGGVFTTNVQEYKSICSYKKRVR